MQPRISGRSGVFMGFALLLLAACQVYDFEPVSPYTLEVAVAHEDLAATAPKPNLFFLVDRSASMSFSADPSPACGVCAAKPCPSGSNCITRWSALNHAMADFTANSGQIAHLGMLAFPKTSTGDACLAPTTADLAELGVALDGTRVDDGAALQAKADEVLAKIRQLSPSGGTPTGLSVRALGQYTSLVRPEYHRASFVVLLTDGLPNCNRDNQPQVLTCHCTGGVGAGGCLAPQSPGVAPNNQCLDAAGTAAQIKLLREQYGVRTIVVGFGADITGQVGRDTLDTLAKAGGFQRPCKTDNDCGSGDTCAPGGVDACGATITSCTKGFYQAASAQELGAALTEIRDQISCNPCSRALPSTPKDPRFVSVIIDGNPVLPGSDTWSVVGSNVVFAEAGALCQRIRSSTTLNPLKAEFRVANPLE